MVTEVQITDPMIRKDLLITAWAEEEVPDFEEEFGSLEDFRTQRNKKVDALVARMNLLRNYFPDIHADVSAVVNLGEESSSLYGELINSPKGEFRQRLVEEKTGVDNRSNQITQAYLSGGNPLEILFITGLKDAIGLRMLIKTE